MNKGSAKEFDIRIFQMEESGSYWPDGSQAVLDPFICLNFSWPEWSPEAVEEFPHDDCFQLPAMATATADGVTDVSSVDGRSTSAIFSDCRSLSNISPSAAQEHNRKKRPQPVAEAEAPSFKRHRSSTISFRRQDLSSGSSSSTNPDSDPDHEAIAQMKEMMYRAAAFRPVSFLPEETAKRPRRRNVRISSDPQTTAARIRRERVSERIRTLQKLVPGGRKMDTASILDEAANYLKFLKKQIKATENAATGRTEINGGRISFSTVPLSLCSYMQNYFNL